MWWSLVAVTTFNEIKGCASLFMVLFVAVDLSIIRGCPFAGSCYRLFRAALKAVF